MSNIQKAIDFTKKAHAGQKRKYTGHPYYYHCMDVAKLIKESEYGSDINICAALLHDTLEDTKATFNQIMDEFGFGVAIRVFFLTDISAPEDGNRQERKAMDREFLLESRIQDVYAIKCADMIDNTKSITRHDKNFAKTYLKEKKLLLEGMRELSPSFAECDLWLKAYSYV